MPCDKYKEVIYNENVPFNKASTIQNTEKSVNTNKAVLSICESAFIYISLTHTYIHQ